jgi:hypothetical protein
MFCVPEASAEVVNLAVPAPSFTVPTVAVPFLNVTVPAGVLLNCGVTVAVKVTDCPKADGFTDEASVVVVLALSTTWLNTVDVLVVNEVLPS